MHAEASYASDGGQSNGGASAPSRESSFNTPQGRIFSRPAQPETGYRHKHAAKFLTHQKAAKPAAAVAAPPVRVAMTAMKQRPSSGAGNIKASYGWQRSGKFACHLRFCTFIFFLCHFFLTEACPISHCRCWYECALPTSAT